MEKTSPPDPETEKKSPSKKAEGKKKTSSYGPADQKKTADLLKKPITYLIIAGGVIILMGLVISASHSNTSKYYLKASEGAVEIWQGTFSPAGKKRILIMPGVQPPEKIKKVYSKEEVYPIAFNFYIGKADVLMEVPGMPDFVGIKSYLNRALFFAITEEVRQIAYARLNSIDLMILLYKADVAVTKGTRAGLEAALEYLNQAAALKLDDIETELIQKKKKSIRELKKAL